MSRINERWLEQQRSRWLRPDYERYLRPDRARHENPGGAQQNAAPNSRWLPLAHAEHEQKGFSEEQVSLADLRLVETAEPCVERILISMLIAQCATIAMQFYLLSVESWVIQR